MTEFNIVATAFAGEKNTSLELIQTTIFELKRDENFNVLTRKK